MYLPLSAALPGKVLIGEEGRKSANVASKRWVWVGVGVS